MTASKTVIVFAAPMMKAPDLRALEAHLAEALPGATYETACIVADADLACRHDVLALPATLVIDNDEVVARAYGASIKGITAELTRSTRAHALANPAPSLPPRRRTTRWAV